MPEFQHTLAGQTGAPRDVKMPARPLCVDSRGGRAYDAHRCGAWSGSRPDSPDQGDVGLQEFAAPPDTITKNISYSLPRSVAV